MLRTPRNTDADKERSSTDWDGMLYDDIPKMDFTGKKVQIQLVWILLSVM